LWWNPRGSAGVTSAKTPRADSPVDNRRSAPRGVHRGDGIDRTSSLRFPRRCRRGFSFSEG
jgi:hypothetical protein